MRLNPHAIIGIPLIAGMIGSVAVQWDSPNWWNIFVFASICVIVYSITVVILTINAESNVNYEGYGTRDLMDIALAFWIVGTWLPPAHNDTSILFLILYFFASLSAGIACSYRLLRRYPPAIIGIPIIAVMAWSVAAQWGSPNWWNIFVFASVCVVVYSITVPLLQKAKNEATSSATGMQKGLLDIHLASAFWIVGTWLPPAHSEGTSLFLIFYFFVSLLVGLGCPFLVLRTSP